MRQTSETTNGQTDGQGTRKGGMEIRVGQSLFRPHLNHCQRNVYSSPAQDAIPALLSCQIIGANVGAGMGMKRCGFLIDELIY